MVVGFPECGNRSGPSGSFASGTLAVPVAAGVATFSDLVLTTSGKYTLSASDEALSMVAPSGTITINPTAASRLQFVAQPVNGTHGVGLSSAVTVAVVDQYGNLATSGALNSAASNSFVIS